jgi:hypothetical protein
MSDTASFDAPATLPFTEAPSTAAIEAEATCDQCGGLFTPRTGSGGKPQRFCRSECRTAFHAQRDQRAPTCDADSETVATEARRLGEVFKAELAAAEGDAALVLADTLNRIDAARNQPEPEPEPDSDPFTWDDPEDVIIRRQPMTAVYWNGRGSVVIRQEAEWNDNDDPFLTFDPHNLPNLIHRLTVEYESWKRDRS